MATIPKKNDKKSSDLKYGEGQREQYGEGYRTALKRSTRGRMGPQTADGPVVSAMKRGAP